MSDRAMGYTPSKASGASIRHGSEEAAWMQSPRAGTEHLLSQTTCSRTMPFDSCVRVNVIAILSIDLLINDGSLHESRDNWACPFDKCKKTFTGPKAMIHHVSKCTDVSGGYLYCNMCDQRGCFALLGRHDGHCAGEDGVDRVEGKRTRTIRKVKNMFSRSRPGSRSSSPSLSIVQTFGRRSIMGMSPSLISQTGARPHSQFPPPPQSHTLGPAAAPQPHEMDAHVYSELFADIHMPMELAASTTGAPRQQGDWEFQTVSPMTPGADVPPMFADDQVFMESPIDESTMDSKIPDYTMQSAYATGPSYTAESSQSRLPSTKNSNSSSDSLMERYSRPSWDVGQHTAGPFHTTQVAHRTSSDATCQSEMALSIYTGSYSDVTMGEAPVTHPVALSSNWPVTSLRPRNASGDSYSSGSTTFSQQSMSSPGTSTNNSSHSQLPSTDTPAGDFKCPSCDFHPALNGKRENWATYLSKHMKTHNPSKILCVACLKEFTRLDNLKVHQRASCQKRPLVRKPLQLQPPGWNWGQSIQP